MNSLCIAMVAMSLVAQAGVRKVPEEDVLAKFADHTFKFTGGDYKDEVFHYRLLSPEKIEPGKKYPVILFLHGAGERGDDNARPTDVLSGADGQARVAGRNIPAS